MSSTSSDSILQIKQKFTLLGHSMLPIIEEEISQLASVNSICRIDRSELAEKWKYPLINSINGVIETEYCVKVSQIVVKEYQDGDAFSDYIEKSNVFMVLTGNSRKFITTSKIVIDDGDMIFLDKEFLRKNKYFAHIKKDSGPTILLMFMVQEN